MIGYWLPRWYIFQSDERCAQAVRETNVVKSYQVFTESADTRKLLAWPAPRWERQILLPKFFYYSETVAHIDEKLTKPYSTWVWYVLVKCKEKSPWSFWETDVLVTNCHYFFKGQMFQRYWSKQFWSKTQLVNAIRWMIERNTKHLLQIFKIFENWPVKFEKMRCIN